jgi:23S rRNA (pseudouridine1915-N3)-methyltransferase
VLTIDIICVGKMKGHDLAPAFDHYARQIHAKINVIELDGRDTKSEQEKILSKINPAAALIVMDERGKSLSSREFSAAMNDLQVSGHSHLQFIIGGADGLNDDIRNKARATLSFGRATWPHILLRVMLIEQIYRAMQILSGHPYHRD